MTFGLSTPKRRRFASAMVLVVFAGLVGFPPAVVGATEPGVPVAQNEPSKRLRTSAPYVGSDGKAPELVAEFPEGVMEGPPVPSVSTPVEVPTEELPERVEEVLSERTATSDVWLNSDGSFTRTEYSEPKYFDAGGGRFELIDSSVVPDSEKGWFRNAANSWVARFGPVTAEGGGIEVIRGADRVAFTPSVEPGITVQPQIGSGDTANVVTYPDVWKNVDIRYTVTPTGVKEDIVVKAPGVDPEFAFAFESSEPMFVDGASKGAVLPSDGGGLTIAAPEVISKDGASLDEAARPSVQLREQAPEVPLEPTDSSTPTTEEQPPSTESRDEYVLSVDPGWLAAQTSFPVIIDPTIGATQTELGFAVYAKASPSGALSTCAPATCTTLRTGWNNGSFWYRSIEDFGLADVLADSGVVTNANVTLTGSGSFGSRSIQLHDPSSYDYNGATPGPTPLATVTLGANAATANVDVTSYIRGQVDLGEDVVPLGFRGDEPPSGAATLKYFTAALSVTYTRRPPAPALSSPVDGKVFATTTPTLNISPVTDPDGDPVTYAFQVSTAPGSTGQVINSGWISATSWQVPAGVLRDGVTYYWTAFARDGSSVAAVSLPGDQRSFTVDLLLGSGKNTPSDTFGPVSVNLVTGNVSTAVSTPEMSTVGGGVSVGFSYNSQTPLAGGLDARYYADANADRSYAGDPVVLARRDSTVFFDWGTGSPGYSVPADNFIVRWDGYVTVPAPGSYTFGAISDDGARIWVGDTAASTPNVLDDWTNHGVPSSPLWSTTPVSFASGSLTKRIRIEYYDATASAVMKLYAKEGAGTGIAVPASWLSASPPVLPHGWTMASSTISSYASARITNDAVTLVSLDGASWEFKKTVGGGFVPPAGVKDVVTQGPDGAVTVIGEDGVTTSFSPEGQFTSATTGGDDQKQASPKYEYSGDPLRLDKIIDPVSGQFVNLVYQGDSEGCGSPPSGLEAAPDGRLCRVVHFDGTDTKLWYAGGGTLLGRIENPGGELYDYGYDSSGRLNKVRDPLAADAFSAGVRTDASTIVTDIAYGGSPSWATNWATSVTLPAPNTSSDPRPQHTYSYQYNPNTDPATGFPITTVVDTGLPAWDSGTQSYSGTAAYARQVVFDARLRLVSETDATGKTSTTSYDAEDRVTSTVDASGMKSTSVYDYAGRVTSSYGPGVSSLFSGDTSSSTAVPRTDYAYDTRTSNGEQQLAGVWWDGADFNDGGSPPDPRPVTRTTMGTAENWGSFQPVPGADFPDFSVRITGWVRLDTAGDYRFYLTTGTAGRMWIDGQLVADTAPATGGNWIDPSSTVTTPDGALFANPTAGSWHQIRVDLRNTNSSADYALQWKTPGSGTLATIPPGNVAPGFGNQTTTIEYDTAGGGNRTTTTDYGQLGAFGQFAGPQHGLPTAVTDAAGNTTATSYERADSNGWMRRLTRTLPAGNGYSYTYWGDNETSSQCQGTATNQAGRPKRATSPDPDGAGAETSITYDTVYTARGQIAGTKNSGNPTWSCVTYDSRGRPLTQTHPGYTDISVTPNVAVPTRTVTYTYSGLTTTVSDGTAGTSAIVTKVDLLGRVVEYTDAWNRKTTFTYDRWGRVTATAAPGIDTLHRYYDAAGRVELVRLGGTAVSDEVADPNYDTAGRLLEVFYRSGSGKKGNSTKGAFTYDTNNGEIKKIDWNATVPVNPTPITSNEVRYSRSGMVVDEVIDGTDPHRTGTTNLTLDNYTYDQAERLVDARVAGQQSTYTFNATGGCGLLATAGKNTNRTTKVTNGGTPVTYCYDNADRLISTTESGVGTISYDARGNTTTIFDETRGYDSADRHYYTKDNPVGTAIRYTHDAEDRIIQREIISNTGTVTGVTRFGYPGDPDIPSVTLDNASPTPNVIESIYALPGGVLLTKRSAGNVWSYPNIHGDITATVNQSGTKLGSTVNYDPFGSVVAGTHPDNLNSSMDYGWLGQHQRPTELRGELQPIIEMGARQYSPLLGRFLEVDPIDGGSANDYDYANGDPISSVDLDGELPQKKKDKKTHRKNQRKSNWNKHTKAHSSRNKVAKARKHAGWVDRNTGQRNLPLSYRNRSSAGSRSLPGWLGWLPAAGVGLWYAAKIFSPLCGPAAPACVVVL